MPVTFRSFITPLGFSLLAVTTAVAQSPGALYMPRSVKEAYARGTRSPDGRPGPRYWQNRGRYEIEVTVQPPSRTVRGTERITYMNNSPDTLRMLGLKLFMNEHKAGSPSPMPRSAASRHHSPAIPRCTSPPEPT